MDGARKPRRGRAIAAPMSSRRKADGVSPSSACAIQAGVNARDPTPYYKPGFGLVGSGLDDEQLRICSARAPEDDERSR